MPLQEKIRALGDRAFRRHYRSSSVPTKLNFERKQKFNSTVTFSRSRSLINILNILPSYSSMMDMDQEDHTKQLGETRYVTVEQHNPEYDLYTPKLYDTIEDDSSLHGTILGNHDVQFSHTMADEECPNTHWPVYDIQGEKTTAILFSINHKKCRRNFLTRHIYKFVRKCYKIVGINKLQRIPQDEVFDNSTSLDGATALIDDTSSGPPVPIAKTRVEDNVKQSQELDQSKNLPKSKEIDIRGQEMILRNQTVYISHVNNPSANNPKSIEVSTDKIDWKEKFKQKATDLDKKNVEYQQLQKQYKKEKEQLQQECQELKSDLRGKTEVIDQQLITIQQQAKGLKEGLENSSVLSLQKETEVTNLNKTLEIKDKKITELENNAAKQEKKISECLSKIDELDIDLLEANHQIQQLKDNQQTEQTIAKKVILERDNAMAQCELKDNEIEQQCNTVQQLQAKVNQLQILLDEQAYNNEQLEAQIENLADAMDGNDKTIEIQKKTITSLRQFKETIMLQQDSQNDNKTQEYNNENETYSPQENTCMQTQPNQYFHYYRTDKEQNAHSKYIPSDNQPISMTNQQPENQIWPNQEKLQGLVSQNPFEQQVTTEQLQKALHQQQQQESHKKILQMQQALQQQQGLQQQLYQQQQTTQEQVSQQYQTHQNMAQNQQVNVQQQLPLMQPYQQMFYQESAQAAAVASPPQLQQINVPRSGSPTAVMYVPQQNGLQPIIFNPNIQVVQPTTTDTGKDSFDIFLKFYGTENTINVHDWLVRIEATFKQNWDDEKKLRWAVKHLSRDHPRLKNIIQRECSSYEHFKTTMQLTFGDEFKPFNLSQWSTAIRYKKVTFLDWTCSSNGTVLLDRTSTLWNAGTMTENEVHIVMDALNKYIPRNVLGGFRRMNGSWDTLKLLQYKFMDLIALIVGNERDWPFIWHSFNESLPTKSNDDKNLYTINTIASNVDIELKQDILKPKETETKQATPGKTSPTPDQNNQNFRGRGRRGRFNFRGSGYRGRGQGQQTWNQRDDQQQQSQSQQMQRFNPNFNQSNYERSDRNRSTQSNYSEQNYRPTENANRRGYRPYRGNWNYRGANQNVNSMESQSENNEFGDPVNDQKTLQWYNHYQQNEDVNEQANTNFASQDQPSTSRHQTQQPPINGPQRQQQEQHQQQAKNGQTPTQMERPHLVGAFRTYFGPNNQ